MPEKLQIKSLWKKHINSFPADTSTLQILSSCMQFFSDEQLSFREWASVIKECLSTPKEQNIIPAPRPTLKAEINEIKPSKRSTIENEIVSFLKLNPGIKAIELSTQLGYHKSLINSILYKLKQEKVCRKDTENRWFVISETERTFSLGKIEKQDQLLDRYETYFRNLKVSKRGEKHAPHKYVLLISVARLIEKGILHSNRVESSLSLEIEFKSVWHYYVSKETEYKCAHTYPFWHMMSEPFWRIFLQNGTEITNQWGAPITTVSRQRKEIYAKIDDDLFNLFQNDSSRKSLINVLIGIISNNC